MAGQRQYGSGGGSGSSGGGGGARGGAPRNPFMDKNPNLTRHPSGNYIDKTTGTVYNASGKVVRAAMPKAGTRTPKVIKNVAKSPMAKDVKKLVKSSKAGKTVLGVGAVTAGAAKVRSNDKAQQKMISDLRVKYDKSAAKKGGMSFAEFQKKYGK